MTIDVVVPFPRPGVQPTPRRVASVPPLPAAPRLALIDNGKPKAATLLQALGEELVRRGTVSGFEIFHKRSMTPISDDERDRLVDAVDIVVSGVGDCGGCTACSVTDALRCLERGVPSFILATHKFEFLVDATDEAYGLDGLGRLYVDHPVWSRSEAWFSDAAEALAGAFGEAVRSGGIAAGRGPGPERVPGDVVSAKTVVRALQGLSNGLAVDGYRLAVAVADETVRIEVEPVAADCPECLVPQEVLRGMIHDALARSGMAIPVARLILAYP